MIRCRGVYKNIRMPLIRGLLKAKENYPNLWSQENLFWSSVINQTTLKEQEYLIKYFEKITKIKSEHIGIVHHSIVHVDMHTDCGLTKATTWLYVIDCATECYLIEEDQEVLLKPYHLYTLNNHNRHGIALSENCHKRLQCLTIDHLLE